MRLKAKPPKKTMLAFGLALILLPFFSSLNTVHAQTTTIYIMTSSNFSTNIINATTYYPPLTSLHGVTTFGRIGQLLTGGQYVLYRLNFRFNTSTLPIGAFISSASIQTTVLFNNLDEPLSWTLNLYSGNETLTSWPIKPFTTEDSKIITTTTPVGETFIFNVNGNSINRTGYTYFAFHSLREDQQLAPTSQENLFFCAGSTCTSPTWLTLSITYTTNQQGPGVTQGAGGDLASFPIAMGSFFGFSGASAQIVGGFMLIFILWVGMTLAIVVPMAKFRVRSETIGMIEAGGSVFLLLMGIAFTWLPIWILVVLIILGIGGISFGVSDRVSRRGTG